MRNRASVLNLVLSLGAFLVFMVILLSAIGSGVGTTELAIWLIMVALGTFLIIRRYRRARTENRAMLAAPATTR